MRRESDPAVMLVAAIFLASGVIAGVVIAALLLFP
jgi:hypothetical protein